MTVLSACMTLALTVLGEPNEIPHQLVWPSENLGARHHSAIEMRPVSWNGWVIVLLGGGLVTDEDWTVPGSITDPQTGEVHTFTLDGEPTHDAHTIAKELVSRGYAVWRWSSVHDDDALHAVNPAMAEPLSFSDSVELTNFTVRRLLDTTTGLRGAVLVGHSLGACRAVIAGVNDDRVRGFVFLAGARLTPVPDRPTSLCERAMAETDLDADGDGVLSGTELAAAQAARWDTDGDGEIRGWEIAGTEAAFAGGWPEPGRDSQLSALIASRKPTLALFGGLDPMSVHGPVLAMEAGRAGAPIEVEYFESRGHQLSVERDGLCDDIDAEIVTRLAEWIDELRETQE